MNDRLLAMTVREAATIRDAIAAIERGQATTAFVVDGDGRLVGLVTDGDIRRAALKGIGPDVALRTITNTTPVTLRQDAHFDAPALYRMMIERHLICIPVLDGDGRVADFVHLPRLAERVRVPDAAVSASRPSRVLVIGGAGYIGSTVVRGLANRKYRVRVLDSLFYGDDSLRGLLGDDVELVRGDTRSIQAVAAALRDVDAVIHLGEIVGDPACEVNADFTIDVNYLATRRIAETCQALGVARFVFASSCSVYGAGGGRGVLSETSAVNPVSLYARCKVEAEQALLPLATSGFVPTIFRFATVFGLSARPRFDLVVNLLAAQAATRGRIKIIGGERWRPFVHVTDVAEALVQCLEMPAERVGGEIFNLGHDELNYRLNDVAALITRLIPGVIVDSEDGQGDPRDYRVSFDKLRRVFGLKPGRTVEDGVLEIKHAIEQGRVADFTDKRYSNYRNLVEA